MPGEGERERLFGIFLRALAAVHGADLAQAALCDCAFRHVIALGKAAESLAAGAWRGDRGEALVSGFIACPRGYQTGELPAAAPFRRCLGGHPLPDAASLAAGTALADYVRALPARARVAVLLSGGASACVEWPRAQVDLALLRRANAWLLASGLPITAMNRVRQGLSRLKGGGLARLLAGRECAGFVLVDVPGGGAEWVAGGPLTVPAPAPLPGVPPWLRSHLGPPGDAPPVPLHRLAGNEEAVAAVAAQGAVVIGALAGDVLAAAAQIAAHVRAAAPGLYVWGGEAGLRLPARAGRGGRCRHLALAVARALAGAAGWCLLAGASDGWDGSDAVAGACVDGATVARGRARGRNAAADLAHADSGGFFAGSGEEIVTGPTGTNVNDLVIFHKGRNT